MYGKYKYLRIQNFYNSNVQILQWEYSNGLRLKRDLFLNDFSGQCETD